MIFHLPQKQNISNLRSIFDTTLGTHYVHSITRYNFLETYVVVDSMRVPDKLLRLFLILPFRAVIETLSGL